MIIEKIVVGPIETNCYLLACDKTKAAIIIDPGEDAEAIKERIKEKGLKPQFIINTHGHFDHVTANRDFDLPVYIHTEDASSVAPGSNPLKGNDRVELGTLKLKILHTPGHTPGGISILVDKVLFSGDTLFCNGVGRTDFPYGSEENLILSIQDKLFSLPDDVKVYPGHGPETTIGTEKARHAG